MTSENKAKYCLESPAGLIGDIDKNEDVIKCAKKELLEETGYIAAQIYFELKNSSSSSGLTSETLSYVTAIVEDDNLAQKPVDDGGVILDRIYIPYDEIYKKLSEFDTSCYSISSAMLAGIFYAQNRFKNELQ